MPKEKARDGSIEFVSAGSKERFLHFGQQALIWNDETLKQKAAAKAAALKEVEAMAAAPAGKAMAVPFGTEAGAPQTTSFEGVLYAFEGQGASRSIGGGATPVVMPPLDEDFIGSVLPEDDVANFFAEFEAELDA
jgi:hypothetical protein